LAAGTYLITAEARVSGSTRTMTQRILNGSAEIATTRSSVYAYSSSYYYSTFSCAIVTITAASTFYLNVYISSSASVAGYLTAVKLYG
jgi:D-serine deaminase-like pyridoxal phosphate-dependent protein